MENYFSELGTKVPLGAKTRELLANTEIGFGVKEEPIYQWNPKTGQYHTIKSFKGIFRVGEDSNKILGVVGDKYNLVSIAKALEIFDPFVEEGFISYDYAGVAANSKQLAVKVWVLARLQEDYEITKGDKILPYLLLSNSYDGSLSLSIRPTSIRMRCWNQYRQLSREYANFKEIGQTTDVVSVRHTKSGYKSFMDKGKFFIDHILKGAKQSTELYRELNDRILKDNEVKEILQNTFDSYGNAIKGGRKWNPLEELMVGWENGDEGIQSKSGLALYNTVTQWTTHRRGHTTATRFYSAQWGSSNLESRNLFTNILDTIK